jgi:hypothetical protein
MVKIHPFPNGSGRHARIAANVYLKQCFSAAPIDWTAGFSLQTENERRTLYLDALRAADGYEFGPLLQFVGHGHSATACRNPGAVPGNRATISSPQSWRLRRLTTASGRRHISGDAAAGRYGLLSGAGDHAGGTRRTAMLRPILFAVAMLAHPGLGRLHSHVWPHGRALQLSRGDLAARGADLHPSLCPVPLLRYFGPALIPTPIVVTINRRWRRRVM